ncbi:MAG TPA: transcriptional repressor LexA [Geopsychrobacteraceae bacterium]|nr:transcriptional repressor LexA [Geopsychrobacteraceae bacterium]
MVDLTARQQQVYNFLVDFSSSHGYPPTLQEIAGHLSISGNLGVIRHLKALEKKDYIRRNSGSSRGIVLTRTGRMVTLPLVGEVRAGNPQLAVEMVEDFLAVDVGLVKAKDSFILRVRGDSMIDAHILDGDMAIIQPQTDAQDRDIVVVLLDGEATLKRFFREPGHIRLQPENADLEPILVRPDEDVQIVGKVTGIFRSLDE